MLSPEDIDEIHDFIEKKPELYKTIITGSVGEIPMNTIYKMSQNLLITNNVYLEQFDCTKYFHIVDAISNLNKENILVIIQEIGLYCLYKTISNYGGLATSIMSAVNNAGIDDHRNDTFTPYQIVLKEQHQRVVFFTKNSNDNDIKSIKGICEKIFKNEVLVLKTDDHIELTIQTKFPAMSFADTTSSFTSLQEYLNKYYRDLSDRVGVYLPPTNKTITGNDYITYYIGSENKTAMEYDFNKLLKYIPTNTGVGNCITINIINGDVNTNNGSGNFSVKNIPIKDQKLSIAKNWVNDNLPKYNTRASDYYGEYKKYVGDEYVNNGSFNKILSDLGYENRRKDNVHYWCKKESKTGKQ
jgi:hypothetical protein